jgi:5-methylcytosine-specific restriction protein A
LADNPYQETQSDAAGQTRRVWIFPLSLKEGVTLAIPQNVVAELETRQTRVAQRLTDEEIQKRARVSQRSAVGTRRVETAQYQRNVWVAEHAKRRANGTCQLCTKPAPFMDSKGKPYLETHHIEWLSTGGADTISNTVALCPNCHRKMHVINDEADRKFLIARVFGQTPQH